MNDITFVANNCFLSSRHGKKNKKPKKQHIWLYTRWYCCSCSPGSFNQCPRYITFSVCFSSSHFFTFSLKLLLFILLYQFFKISFWERKKNLKKPNIKIIRNPFMIVYSPPPSPYIRSTKLSVLPAMNDPLHYLRENTHSHTHTHTHTTNRTAGFVKCLVNGFHRSLSSWMPRSYWICATPHIPFLRVNGHEWFRSLYSLSLSVQL